MNTIKFSIHRADGSKVPTLKKSFLVKQYITELDEHKGFITLEDGTKWKLILEKDVKIELMCSGQHPSIFCICSYQVHEHGNYVVARICKDKETANITEKDVASWATVAATA